MEISYDGIIRFPAQMENLVWGISSEMKTNNQMVIPIVLTALASIVQGKFEVHFQGDYGHEYKIPLSLYAVLVAKSGSGKSAIFRKLVAPLDELIAEDKRMREEENNNRKIFNEALELQRKDVKKMIRKYHIPIEEAYEILKKIDQRKLDPIKSAEIYTTNCSASGIARALAEQEGHRISVLDPEGSSILKLAEDRYLISQLNHAFDNEKFSAKRGRGENIEQVRGVMSFLSCMQPAKYENLIGKKDIWDEGLLPRMLPFWGVSNRFVLQLKGETEIIHENNLAYRYYIERVEYLFRYACTMTEDGYFVPHTLHLSEGAIKSFKKFERRITPLSIDRDDDMIAPWRIKATTTIIRIAAIFHLYEAVGDPVETPITGEEVEMAGEFIMALIYHVEAIRRAVAPTEDEKITGRVIRLLLNDLRIYEISLRELTRAINVSKQCILPTLLKLLDEGVLEEVRTQHKSPGRPQSPRFLINWPRLKELYIHR